MAITTWSTYNFQKRLYGTYMHFLNPEEVCEDLTWCPCSVGNVLPGVFFPAADALLAQSVKACWLHVQDFGVLTLFGAFGRAFCCGI